MSDLKKGHSSADSQESTHNNICDSIDDSRLNTSTPAFETVRRSGGGEEEEKVCRICLEEDSPETMIAPCLCKGGSKWVHRECLDEWRTNERDRAFSKCTECLFEYHLQPVYQDEEINLNCCCIPCKPQQRRRALFYWMVSRDACLGIVLQQAIVIFLAAVVLACDTDHQLPNLLLGMESFSENKLIWVYYGFGWFAFFIGLGLYGSVVMCTNRCDVNRAIPNLGPPSEADEEEGPAPAAVRTESIPNHQYSYTSYQRTSNRNDGYHNVSSSSCSSSTMFYRRARRRHYHRRHSYWRNDDYYYYYPSYYYYPMYVGNDDSCCCCCCSNPVSHHHGHCCGGSSSGCFGTDCCPGSIHSAIGASRGGSFSGSRSSGSSSSSNSGSNDAQHIVLMILLVVAIVLAIIGFFVGVVIVVVAAQRIVGRHIYLLQKRQLVHEFKVMDLQDYDLDQPLPAAQTEETVGSGIELREGVGRHPPPSAPAMPMEDVQYLKKLGLMDG